MSIETKIVAEFYARLLPWIDHAKEVLVCKDDGGRGQSAIPDLSFCFIGASMPLRIEFKTLDSKNRIGCTTKQHSTWTFPNDAAPHIWIGIDDATRFSFWSHGDADFVRNWGTGERTSSRTHVRVLAPTKDRVSLMRAFVGTLEVAQKLGMLA